MSNDFRIARGFISQYALNNTSTYALTSFPRQSDMTTAFAWMQPTDFSDVLIEGAEYVDALDNSSGAVGGYELDWYLWLPKAGMVQYIEDTIWNGSRSDQFTIQTQTRRSYSAPWVCLWIWGVLPDVRKDAQPKHTGFEKYKVHFFDGIPAAPGNEYTSEFSFEFT